MTGVGRWRGLIRGRRGVYPVIARHQVRRMRLWHEVEHTSFAGGHEAFPRVGVRRRRGGGNEGWGGVYVKWGARGGRGDGRKRGARREREEQMLAGVNGTWRGHGGDINGT